MVDGAYKVPIFSQAFIVFFTVFTSLCRSAGMSVYHQRDEFDYMAEEGTMASVVDDEMGDDLYRRDGAEGVRDEYDLVCQVFPFFSPFWTVLSPLCSHVLCA